MSSTIKRLPDTLINDDPRKRKKTRLTIERQRGPGIFQNAVSGSARRRNSAGDLEFNPLGFLDKLNPKNKKKTKDPSSCSIAPTRRVQRSSRPASPSIQRDTTRKLIKKQAIGPPGPHQEKIPSSNNTSGPNRDIDHEKNLEKKNQITSCGQAIPDSTSRSHSDHTSAHSAYSLMMSKKNKVANKFTVPRSSGQNHIPVEHELKDQPARRSSLPSHHQPSSVQLSDHQDGQNQPTSDNPNPTLGQQVEPQIKYYPLNDDDDDDDSKIQERSFNNYSYFTDPSPDLAHVTTRFYSNQNQIETQSLFSLSYYSMLDDASIENQDNYYATESWIEENGDADSSRMNNISDIPQRMSTPRGLDYCPERYPHWTCCSNSDRTILTELDPDVEYRNLDNGLTSFGSGSLRIDRDDIWGQQSNYDTEIERDVVDEDEDSYDPRRVNIGRRHVVVDEYHDQELDWRADDHLEGLNSDYHDYFPSYQNNNRHLFGPSYVDDDQHGWEYMDQDSLVTIPDDELITRKDKVLSLDGLGHDEEDSHLLFESETWTDFNYYNPSLDRLEEEEKEEIFTKDDEEEEEEEDHVVLQSNNHRRPVYAYPHTNLGTSNLVNLDRSRTFTNALSGDPYSDEDLIYNP